MSAEEVVTDLLPAGGRPLFAGRLWLETIERRAGGQSWEAIPMVHGIACAAALRLLALSIERRTMSGESPSVRPNQEVLFRLPVFWDEAQARRWEEERPWDNPEWNSSETRTAYARLLASAHPSDAYTPPLDGGWQNPISRIWNTWLEHEPVDRVVSTLVASADRVEAWVQQQPGARVPPMAANISGLCKSFGLSEDEALAWFKLECTLGSGVPEATSIFAQVVSDGGGNAAAFRELLAPALRLDPAVLERLLDQESPLVRFGFFSANPSDEQQRARIPGCERYVPQEWKPIWEAWSNQHNARELLARPQPDANALIGAFLPAAAPVEHTVEDWPELKTLVADLVQLLVSRTGKRPRLLLYGKEGTGKTSLATVIAEAAGLDPRSPRWPDAKHRSETPAEAYVKAVSSAAELTSHFERCALLVDECQRVWACVDRKPEVHQILDGAKAPQIWIANSLRDLDPTILRRFDYVVEISEMSLTARTRIARTRFKEPELAFRVAQALRTPAEIVGAARWTEMVGRADWLAVRSWMSSRQQAASAVAGRSSFLPQTDVTGPLPPLVGYPQLDALADSVLDMLANPGAYLVLKAKLPTGILLTGAPGTGKTLFVRHLAARAGIPLFAPPVAGLVSDPDVICEVFREARRRAPCIIFVDEADPLLLSPMEMFVPNLSKQKVVNTLLAEMSGIDPLEGVLVVAATHRSQGLDPGITRAGRFSLHVALDLPDCEARQMMVKAYLEGRPNEGIDAGLVAQACAGFSGAEVAEVIDRAALRTARSRGASIGLTALLTSADEVFWREPESRITICEADRRRLLLHEAGHALMALHFGQRVQRITARPRSAALGAVHWMPEEGHIAEVGEYLEEHMAISLAGIAAEKAILGNFSTGGSSDLERVRRVARRMLVETGMSTEIGHVSGGDPLGWSNIRRRRIELEERECVERAFCLAHDWLEAHKDLVNALAEALLERREMSGHDLEQWIEGQQGDEGGGIAVRHLPASGHTATLHTDV